MSVAPSPAFSAVPLSRFLEQHGRVVIHGGLPGSYEVSSSDGGRRPLTLGWLETADHHTFIIEEPAGIPKASPADQPTEPVVTVVTEVGPGVIHQLGVPTQDEGLHGQRPEIHPEQFVSLGLVDIVPQANR